MNGVVTGQGFVPAFARTDKIQKYAGKIYYVATDGLVINSGLSPDSPLNKPSTAVAAASAGDRIKVKYGNYVDNVDLNKTGLEMLFEIGSQLSPSSGTALTVSGNFCYVGVENGALKINPPAGEAGVIITGNFCYMDEVRVSCGSSAALGFDLQGDGADLRRCRCAAPLTAAFKISGDTNKLENCCTGGEIGDSSIGFWVTGSCDKARLKNCGSQGHETAGYQVDSGCTNGVAENCYSGGGDGPKANLGTLWIFSNFWFEDTILKTVTLDGSGSYDIYEYSGIVNIVEIFGHVTTALTGTNSAVYLEVYDSNGGSDDLTDSPGPSMGALPVGSVIIKVDDPGKDLEVLSAASAFVEKAADPKKKAALIGGNPAYTNKIRLVVAGDDGVGALHFHCKYEQKAEASYIKPA